MMYEWPGVMSQIVACFDNLTDNSICQHNESTYGSSQTIALGDLDPNTGGYVSYMYDHCYRGIARIHLVMENLETYQGADMSEADKSFILAQCKALRSLLLFLVVPVLSGSSFGDVFFDNGKYVSTESYPC